MTPTPEDRAEMAEAAAAVLSKGIEPLGSNDPLQAEMYASQMLAPVLQMVWRDQDEADSAAAAIANVIAQVDQPLLTDAACALVVALLSLEDDGSGDDPDGGLAFMEEALRVLQVTGGSIPGWAPQCGRPQLVGAWISQDVWDDQRSVFLGFQYEGQPAHTLVALIDHNLEGIVKDAYVGSAPEDLLAAWRTNVEGSDDGRFMELDEADPQLATWLVLVAMSNTDESIGAPVTDDLQETYALLHSRIALVLGGSEDMPTEAPASELDLLDAESVLVRFLSSDEYAQAQEAGGSRLAAELIVGFATSWVVGGSTRFSPPVAEELLLEYLPETVPRHQRKRIATSAVPTTQAWARFCAAARDLPDYALEHTLTAIDALASDHRDVMHAEPDMSLGPGGVAFGVVPPLDEDDDY